MGKSHKAKARADAAAAVSSTTTRSRTRDPSGKHYADQAAQKNLVPFFE
ncbi:MAG: hypothetical protein ACR2IJ_09260 [Fluviibacter sp.]